MPLRMEIDRATRIAENLEESVQKLDNIIHTLEDQMSILNSDSFVGRVGGELVKRFINLLQPRLAQMSKGCGDLAQLTRAEIERFKRI